MIAWLIALAIITVPGVLVWRSHLHGLFRIHGCADEIDEQTVDVSVIVPARNEAHNLPPLLQSLRALKPAPREVIVVDDHSSDGTGDIARQFGARVVTPPPLPADWNGKPWACHAGAHIATGEYLLFTDADTVHAPTSLGRALGRMQRDRLDMVSMVPNHLINRFWERLQGVFHLLLLIATGAGRSISRGERRFSIGQYLLFTRAAYQRIDGHTGVRSRIAEDLALARLIVDSGGDIGVEFCPRLLFVRMYPEGLSSFIKGWRRSFFEGMASAGVLATLEITAVIGWLLGVPLLAIAGVAFGQPMLILASGALYLATALEIARQQRHIGAFSVASAALYPGFVVIFIIVSSLAVFSRLRGTDVHWKGRRVLSGQRNT